MSLRAAPVLSHIYSFSAADVSSTSVQGVARDAAGNIYVAGTRDVIPLANPIQSVLSTGNCSPFPTKVFNPCETVFAAKLDSSGTKLLYSTYLPTELRGFTGALAVDAAGNAYIATTQYPVNYYGAAPQGGHVLLYKLDPTGSRIIFQHAINSDTQAKSVAVDSQGNVTLAGISNDLNFPAIHALQPKPLIKSLLVTNDAGVSWRSLNNTLPAVTVYSLATAGGGILYAATSSGLFRSNDAGVTWSHLFPTAV
jgi:hypothetical protein